MWLWHVHLGPPQEEGTSPPPTLQTMAATPPTPTHTALEGDAPSPPSPSATASECEPAAPPPGTNALLGIAAVQDVFTFLDGPAEVLSASVACRRWRMLATADVVWRGKYEREGMQAKAGRFEVLLVEGVGGGLRWEVALLDEGGGGLRAGEGGGEEGGSSNDAAAAAAAAEDGELAGGFLAAYRLIRLLKVRVVHSARFRPAPPCGQYCRPPGPSPSTYTTHASDAHQLTTTTRNRPTSSRRIESCWRVRSCGTRTGRLRSRSTAP